MSSDREQAAETPVRLSPEDWLDHFTDFGKITFHPDPPFLRQEPRHADTPTLRLKRIAIR